MATTTDLSLNSVVLYGQRFNLESLLVSERETFYRLSDQVLQMFPGKMTAEYYETRATVLEQWLTEPGRRDFIEKAIPTFIKKKEIENEDTLARFAEYRQLLQRAGLGYNEYSDWEMKILNFRYRRYWQTFKSSLEKFSECLVKANFHDRNYEAEVVNTFLQEAEYQDFPHIYLGVAQGWPLALNLIGNTLMNPLNHPYPSPNRFKGYISLEEREHVLKCLGMIYGHMFPEIMSLRYKPLDQDGSLQSFNFVHIGHAYRAREKGLDLGAMKENLFVEEVHKSARRNFTATWRMTDATVAMKILDTGAPGELYLLKSGDLWHLETEEGDHFPRLDCALDVIPESVSWTLAEITDLNYSELKSYDGTMTNKVIGLTPVSLSKVEIACPGYRDGGGHDDPPVGIFPLDVIAD